MWPVVDGQPRRTWWTVRLHPCLALTLTLELRHLTGEPVARQFGEIRRNAYHATLNVSGEKLAHILKRMIFAPTATDDDLNVAQLALAQNRLDQMQPTKDVFVKARLRVRDAIEVKKKDHR